MTETQAQKLERIRAELKAANIHFGFTTEGEYMIVIDKKGRRISVLNPNYIKHVPTAKKVQEMKDWKKKWAKEKDWQETDDDRAEDKFWGADHPRSVSEFLELAAKAIIYKLGLGASNAKNDIFDAFPFLKSPLMPFILLILGVGLAAGVISVLIIVLKIVL